MREAPADGEHTGTAPASRVIIVLDGPAGARACRVEAPDRVLRIWALLSATGDELHQVILPAGVIARLHQQLRALIAELQFCVSPALASELRRLIPPEEAAPSRQRNCGSSSPA
ncbi:MAG: hypothetical protein ACLP70_06485 [Streptosporangiaceae bacterium]|jgi:hypothetical protein